MVQSLLLSAVRTRGYCIVHGDLVPHELSPTIELIDPIIPDGSNLVIPSIFLVAAAYASRIIGKFIAHRYQKEE